jgi:hypothetical protein
MIGSQACLQVDSLHFRCRPDFWTSKSGKDFTSTFHGSLSEMQGAVAYALYVVAPSSFASSRVLL